jgi:LysR family transcriptional regulator, mexEF-oprN operon transcriptional activator
MRSIDLHSLDLNLLTAFEALERERSVSRAAARIGIGQPAMSHALGRLRTLLHDELFVRAGGGIEPTPRALELIGPIRAALAQIDTALRGSRQFNPATATDQFRIGMTDIVGVSVLSPLMDALHEAAPTVSLVIRAVGSSSLREALDLGEIDLAIGMFSGLAEWHRTAFLFREELCCVFSRERTGLAAPISLADYVAARHLLVSPRGDPSGVVDTILAKSGTQRAVQLTVPYFLLAGHLLYFQPLVAALPRRFAEQCSTMAGLEVGPLPFDAPTYEISMVWHARHDEDARLSWLRGLVANLVPSMRGRDHGEE